MVLGTQGKESKMFRTKVSIGVLLAIILLATQVFVAGAAPSNLDSTNIGNIDKIEVQTDPDTLESTVLVTVTDETGTKIVELSLETALAFDPPLVTEIDGFLVPNEELVDTDITIDPATVISSEPVEESTEEQHPVASALSDFFFDIFSIEYDTIMTYHEDGVGFGVIAQALWMTNALTSDDEVILPPDLTPEALFGLILDAKKDKNFGGLGITLPDGSEPTNWGQFRKAIMSDHEKAKENLGAIMSGRAEKPSDETLLLEQGIDLKSNNGNGIEKSNNGKNDASKDKSNKANEKSKEKSNNGKNK